MKPGGKALTSPSTAAAEAWPSHGVVVEPRKQEELGSGSRLLPLRPLPLPFGLLTSPPSSAAAGNDDDEEVVVVALLLPDPITHAPAQTPLHRAYRSTDRPRPPAIARPPRLTAPGPAPGCGWPSARRLGGRERGTSAAVASFVPPLQTLA